MKLKTIGFATAISVMGLTSGAYAADAMDLYVGATAGAGAATIFAGDDNHTDSAMSYGLVAGFDIPLLRLEAEYNRLNDTDFGTNIGMINAYFKMPSIMIHPYAGVGVGAMFGSDAPDTRASYQGMLGATFDAPFDIKVDVEGRALYTPNLYTVGDLTPDFLHYDLRLKLRFTF